MQFSAVIVQKQITMTATTHQVITNTKRLTLINGDYSSGEALDMLTNLFQQQINFYKLLNFRAQIHSNTDDPVAQGRISELNEKMELLKKHLSDANVNKSGLKIEAEIFIKPGHPIG